MNLKQLHTKFVTGVALAAGELALLGAGTASAVDPQAAVESGVKAAGGGASGGTELNGFIQSIINVLLFIVGAVAVIMIIVGGIMYVTSAGDPAKTKKAKDTVLYSVVGLVVALLAYAIIGFVLSNLGATTTTTP